MENSATSQSKKKNLYYILIIFFLLTVVGYLAIQINSANKENHAFSQEINLLTIEKKELNGFWKALESSALMPIKICARTYKIYYIPTIRLNLITRKLKIVLKIKNKSSIS